MCHWLSLGRKLMHCIGKDNFVYWCFLLFIFFWFCSLVRALGGDTLFQHWNQAGGLKKKSFEIFNRCDACGADSFCDWKHTVTTTDLGGVFLVFLRVFCIFVCTYYILVLWGSHLWCQFWKIQLYFKCIFYRECWIVFSKIHLYFSLLYFPNHGHQLHCLRTDGVVQCVYF